MLERIGKPEYASLSEHSAEMILLLEQILQNNGDPQIAEVGVGIGATSVKIAEKLANRGQLYLFDFNHNVAQLGDDLKALGFTNLRLHGSSKHTYDSYTWQLLKLAKFHQRLSPHGFFDLIYLDGAHTFIHDVGSTALCKKLVKPGGYLLMDDYNWTFNTSPTMNPEKMPQVATWYSQEQLETPHIKLVCEALLDGDPEFERDYLDGRVSPRRALYRKRARQQS
ncbi:hypothetical protein ASE63_00085 [Bosea sp. Root381]|nr:hypothetical protein ASE63_00085 [Bosea sp. Root381]